MAELPVYYDQFTTRIINDGLNLNRRKTEINRNRRCAYPLSCMDNLSLAPGIQGQDPESVTLIDP